MAVEEILQGDPLIVRRGDTVTRPYSGEGVHALLDYLNRAGWPYAPRVLDLDREAGRETLSFITGESGKHGWAKVISEQGLRRFARLLRSYHDVIGGYLPTCDDWALSSRPPRAGELICHGDFGPWNVVWQGERPVGLIDWDFAGPRRPTYDIAYALEYVAPFRPDEHCLRWLAYTSPPERLRRIEAFADAYGLQSTDGLIAEVIAVQREGIEQVRMLAAAGREPQARWVADGFLSELEARVAWSERHFAALL